MAREDMRWLIGTLLVILASGSWAQDIKSFQKLEGETVSVRCLYRPDQQPMVKSWCRHGSLSACTPVVDSLHGAVSGIPSSMEILLKSNQFIVTMMKLRVEDSGIYSCAVLDYSQRFFIILQTIHLQVVKASTTTATLRRTQTTTAPASASTAVLQSPPTSSWKFITAAVVVTGLLLLGLAVLVALYLRKRQERARKGENESHHICDDTSAQKAEPMVVSDEDAGTICYASVIHVHSLGFKDSIYANIHPAQKPRPEPLPSVEYTSIARSRHQPSLAATPEEVADREAEFPGQ